MNEYYTQKISVVDPISDAIGKTKEILFQPFDLGKWFVIGFCAWLAMLAQSGGGGGGGGGNWQRGDHSHGMQGFDGIREAVMSNLPIVLIFGSIALIVVIALTLLFLWLSSRGLFMFVHCIAENKAEVKHPWNKYLNVGNSLFLFKFAVWGITFICIGVLTGIGALLFFTVGARLQAMGALMIVLPISLLLVPLAIALLVFIKFTNDFVVPIMYLRRCRCTDGWREFWSLLKINKANFALYILFQIVINMAIATIMFALMIATCCIACCIVSIPYLGTVLVLPLLTFDQAYKLYYLAQFGDAYNVFTAKDQQQP